MVEFNLKCRIKIKKKWRKTIENQIIDALVLKEKKNNDDDKL